MSIATLRDREKTFSSSNTRKISNRNKFPRVRGVVQIKKYTATEWNVYKQLSSTPSFLAYGVFCFCMSAGGRASKSTYLGPCCWRCNEEKSKWDWKYFVHKKNNKLKFYNNWVEKVLILLKRRKNLIEFKQKKVWRKLKFCSKETKVH